MLGMLVPAREHVNDSILSSQQAHGVAAILIGIGSGLASSINQVLGMDLAPANPADAATFLGLWRMQTDTGSFLGPLVAGFIAEQTSVFVASDGIAACAIFGGLWLALIVDETYNPKITKSDDAIPAP